MCTCRGTESRTKNQSNTLKARVPKKREFTWKGNEKPLEKCAVHTLTYTHACTHIRFFLAKIQKDRFVVENKWVCVHIRLYFMAMVQFSLIGHHNVCIRVYACLSFILQLLFFFDSILHSLSLWRTICFHYFPILFVSFAKCRWYFVYVLSTFAVFLPWVLKYY